MKDNELKCNYAVAHVLVQLVMVILIESKENYSCFSFFVQFDQRTGFPVREQGYSPQSVSTFLGLSSFIFSSKGYTLFLKLEKLFYAHIEQVN